MSDVHTDNRRKIDIITDDEFLRDLEECPLEVLRGRRDLAGELETEMSYYRRLLHGRMDLLAFELRRRSGDETKSLLEALPEILAAGETGGGNPGGRPQAMLAPDLPDERRRHIDRVLEHEFLSRLPETGDDELTEIQRILAETEQEISRDRRTAQVAFDTIQAEIMRRYEGEVAESAETVEG